AFECGRNAATSLARTVIVGAFPFLLPDFRWICCIFDLLAGVAQGPVRAETFGRGVSYCRFCGAGNRGSPPGRWVNGQNRRCSRAPSCFPRDHSIGPVDGVEFDVAVYCGRAWVRLLAGKW